MPNRAPKSVTPTNPWVGILRPGTHTSMSGRDVTFTSADVASHAAAIKAQLATGFTPPLVVGHPRHDSPRVGSVVDVKVEGDIAYAKVDELTPEFAESCRKGEYKYNSPAFYPNGGLRHLGILGAWNPAMKEQAPIAFGEGMFAEADSAAAASADEILQFAEATDWGSVVGSWLNRLAWRINSIGSVLSRLRDQMIEDKGVEATDKILPAYEIDGLKDLQVPYDLNPEPVPEPVTAPSSAFGEPAASGAPAATPPAAPAAEPTPAPAPVAAPTAREQELQAQLAEAQRKLADSEAAKSAAAFGERLDRATREGRLSPVLRSQLEKLHAEIAATGELAFADGAPMRSLMEGVVDSLPQIVTFGEMPQGRTPVAKNPLIADAEARHRHGD